MLESSASAPPPIAINRGVVIIVTIRKPSSGVDCRIEALEVRKILAQLGKAAAQVEALGVFGNQQPTPQATEPRMGRDRFDQPLSESGIAFLGNDEDVREIRECRLVANDPGKSDLQIVAIKAEGQRVSDRAAQDVEQDVTRPVRGFREKMMDHRDIEPVGVGIDLVTPAAEHAAGKKAIGHRAHSAARFDDAGTAKMRCPTQPRQRAEAAIEFVVAV
jgi:hypothetical protein